MSNHSRPHRRKQRQDRRLMVRSVRLNPPDYKKLAGALIDLALAQTEADARAEHERKHAARRRRAEQAEDHDQSRPNPLPHESRDGGQA